eukprot:3639793-Prymnesium_polylepis.1
MLATLDAFKTGELYELLDAPPKYAADPAEARRRYPALPPPPTAQGGSIGEPTERQSYASTFGDVDWVLPKDFDGYEPVGAPPWLSRAL